MKHFFQRHWIMTAVLFTFFGAGLSVICLVTLAMSVTPDDETISSVDNPSDSSTVVQSLGPPPTWTVTPSVTVSPKLSPKSEISPTSVPSSTPVPPPSPTAVPTHSPTPTQVAPMLTATANPTHSPTPTAILAAPRCSEILTTLRNGTSAQWSQLKSDIEGKWVIDWRGTIRDVGEKSWLLGGYAVYIAVVNDCDLYYVVKTDAEALAYSKGDEVVVNAQVRFIGDFLGGVFGITLHLDSDNAIIETYTPATTEKSVTSFTTPTSTAVRPLSTPTIISGKSVSVNRDANLREGPGTEFAIVGGATAGQTFNVAGVNPQGDWYILEDGRWIASFLVDGIPVVPTVISRITPNPTVTPNPPVAETTPEPSITSVAVDTWISTPPQGTWCVGGTHRGVCVGDFRYVTEMKYERAPSNGRYIAFAVVVKNFDTSSIHVNPVNVTLVMADGRTYAYSAQTFSYWSSPMDAVNVSPGDIAEGGIVFLVPNDVSPERVVYRGGIWESEIVVDLRKPPSN